MCHDMRMAERNRGAGLDQGKVRLKKHLHRLRPFLACMRIDQGMEAPPIEFGALLDRFLPSGSIQGWLMRWSGKISGGMNWI